MILRFQDLTYKKCKNRVVYWINCNICFENLYLMFDFKPTELNFWWTWNLFHLVMKPKLLYSSCAKSWPQNILIIGKKIRIRVPHQIIKKITWKRKKDNPIFNDLYGLDLVENFLKLDFLEGLIYLVSCVWPPGNGTEFKFKIFLYIGQKMLVKLMLFSQTPCFLISGECCSNLVCTCLLVCGKMYRHDGTTC